MGDLIDKDALVAKIIKRIQESLDAGGATRGVYLSERMKEDSYILSIIDTLEVKELDLEKEISFQWSKFCLSDKDKDSFIKVAKHFFELGLSVNNKVQKGE